MQSGNPRRRSRYVRLLLLIAAAIVHANAVAPHPLSSQAQSEEAGMQKLLPAHAILEKQITVAFANGSAVALSYSLPPVYAVSYNLGLRILRRTDSSGWSVVYEETQEIDPGGDELILHKVKAMNGPEGLVVVNYHSGAGTTTDWKAITEVNKKFISLNSARIRDKVLRRVKSQFGGYNGVRVEGDLVIERIPLYSSGQARCCSDRPPIDMRVRFTGSALKLDSVRQLPSDAPAQ
jgi:hypothetical protein